ncbi:MAG: hypothetical protein U0Q22_19270 [Acidimicrobiales bacterium]
MTAGAPRVGVVGTGMVGSALIRRLVASHAVTVTALSSDDLADGPEGVDVVVLCTPDGGQTDEARVALAAGCHVVSLADSLATVSSLLGLEDYAAEVGRSVVVGAAASPGLTTTLAVHASALFDEVDEISVAASGVAGPACAERRARASRTDSQEWRDGRWSDVVARSGSELVWFPDPVGAVDCGRGDLSEGILLHRLLREVPTISVRVARDASVVARPRVRRRSRSDGGPTPEAGGVLASVTGRVDGASSTVVYACVAPAAVSSSALAAVVTRRLLDGGAPPVATVVDVARPVELLRDLAAMGVRSLVFEGVA